MNNRSITYICYALITLFAMFLAGTSPLLIEISKTFKLSTSQSGTIFTFNFVGFVIFVLAAGVISDRFGKKVVLSTSLAGFTISLFLFPLSPNYYIACAVMLFLGGFGGVIEGVVSALVADLNTENTSFYINMTQVFFGVGALLGPILISILVSNGIMWQLNYFILGSLSLVITIIFVFSKLPHINKSEDFSMKNIRFLVSDKKVLLVAICMIFYTGAEVGSWGWMATYLKESFNFTALKSSIAVGIFWSSMTIGRLACGPLILKFGARKVVSWLALSSAVVIVLSGIAKNEALLLVVAALMGLAFSSQWALIASYGSEDHKDLSGSAFSIFVASGGVGGAIVPFCMGFISEKAGMNIAMMSPALLFFAVAIIFISFKKASIVEKTVSVK